MMALTLANLLFVSLNLGGPGVKFLVLTFQIGDEPPVSYDLLQLLLILGISIVAAVLLERLLWRGTPGGLLGAFLISLIGIGLFLALIPLVWQGNYSIDGIPLMTAIVGAFFSLLVVHLLFVSGVTKDRAGGTSPEPSYGGLVWQSTFGLCQTRPTSSKVRA